MKYGKVAWFRFDGVGVIKDNETWYIFHAPSLLNENCKWNDLEVSTDILDRYHKKDVRFNVRNIAGNPTAVNIELI